MFLRKAFLEIAYLISQHKKRQESFQTIFLILNLKNNQPNIILLKVANTYIFNDAQKKPLFITLKKGKLFLSVIFFASVNLVYLS